MHRSPLIDAPALAALLGTPDLVILDCRFDLASPEAGRSAWLAGHIPGAHYAHLERDLSGPVTPTSGRHPLPAAAALGAWLASLGVRPGVLVVAYDEANAAFAARAWWLLRWLGHEEVAVLDGGLKAWTASGGRLECGEPNLLPRPAPASMAAPAAPAAGEHAAAGVMRAPATACSTGSAPAPIPDRGAALDTEELMNALAGERAVLVDARAPERFAGEVEPIDPIAGHVPGAVNHPFQSNLGSDGRFLPPAELARRWRARLAGRSAREAIMMCGSGVTACQNLLALEVAGLPGAKLYAGSWSEWIRDPHRPVARGR